jgi:cytochrome P450
MAEIAVPIPILVIARLIGVPETRIDDFRVWSEAAVLGLNPVRTPEENEKMAWGQKALEKFFLEQMEDRRQSPREDLITDLVKIQAAGNALSDTEIRLNLTGLLIGGNLTTTDLFGNGLRALLLHPGEMIKLRGDLNLLSLAIEEMLRFDPPVTNTTRVISEDRLVGGCPMKQRQSVWVSLNGANRDPEVVDHPDRFNITRKHVPHVSFGGGAHICVGAPLARLEAKFFFRAMLDRYKSI